MYNVTITARFISAKEPFSYPDDEQGRWAAGVSRKAWVLPDGEEVPALVKFSADHAEAFDSLRKEHEFGELVCFHARIVGDRLDFRGFMPLSVSA
jgi:hypothetical protein